MKKTLYLADTLITMNKRNEVIVDGGLLVEGTVITDVGSGEDLRVRHKDADIVYFPKSALMPGLINTHCHSGLLRGTAEGLPVWEWLQKYIDPMHRVLKPEEAALASRLCYAEALLSGTTTIVDMWRYMHGSAAAAR